MYASQNHVYGHNAVTDQRQASRQAAERYAQVSAVAEDRRSRRSAKRQARDQRQGATVAVTA